MAAVAHLRPNYAGYIRGLVVDGSVLSIGGTPVATVTRTGSASDITTGVLPVAQVPNLDAGKITSGTMSLARLPPSSSNMFTGYNQAGVSGTGASPFGQGGFFAWNRDSTGKTAFANNRGTGSGGWEFVGYNADKTFAGVAATLSAAGGLALSSLQAGTTLLNADGTVSAGGTVALNQGSAAGGTQLLFQQAGTPACAHRIASRHYASTLAGNALDFYLWTWGVDGSSQGSQLGLSVTQTGIGINNTPNPAFGVDCNGSANVAGVIRGLGVGGLLLRVFDESNTAFPSSGALPELFRGRPVDAQFVTSINYPVNSSGVAIAAGYTQNYSVRISGFLKAPSSDTYAFSVYADDGVRVWVNGTKVLDAWQVQATTLTSNAIALGTAWVPFRIEYCQGAYGSGLQVQWKGAANNPSYALLAHSATGSGFQMAYDNLERPPTSMGTTWFNGKALFTENCGFGGQGTPAYPVDVAGGLRASGDALLNTLGAGALGSSGAAGVGYAGLGAAGYGLLQTSAGATRVGSVAGQGITFRDSDVAGMTYVQGKLRVGDAALPQAALDVAGTGRVAPGLLGLVAGTSTGGSSSMAAQAKGMQLEVGVAGAAGDLSSGSAIGDCVVRATPTSTGAQQRLLLQCGQTSPSVVVGANGMVGVGTTTAPSYTLDVGGTGHVSGAVKADGVLYMNNQSSSCILALSSTTAGIPASNATTYYGLGMLPGTGMRYQVAANASDSHVFMGGTTEIMRITNSGGGTTVAGPLTVSGQSTLASAQVQGALSFAGTGTTITGTANSTLSILGGGGNKGLAVDYNSRVGVGTTAPGFPLDVVGAIRVQSSGAPAAVYSYANGQVNSFWSAGSDSNNNYAIGNQSGVGTYLANGQTSWTSSSDARLKTAVRTIESGLDLVDRIRPVSFRWLQAQPDGRQFHRAYGVIAQELQDVIPEVVDDAGTQLGVRYQELIPFLIKAVQELRAEVRALQQAGAHGSVPAA